MCVCGGGGGGGIVKVRLQCLLQAISRREQCLEGTQRLEDPVSNTTSNFCGGVPMVMGP